MKVLICGDRNLIDERAIASLIKTLPKDTIVIHGGARGADRIAGKIAKEQGLQVKVFEAQWKLYGRAAGPVRNTEMLTKERPDFVVAFHDDLSKSRGTKDMINIALKKSVTVKVIKPSEFDADESKTKST